MKRNILRSFDDKTHFYGRIWGVIAAALIIAYPFVCMGIFGASINWGLFASGLSIIVMYCAVGAVETFTYTPMLGSGGTYLGFVTGNLSNLKVPCALNCMEQAGVEKGTEEAEVISTISIAVSSIVTMLIIVLGVVLISFLTPVFENEALAPAFDNVLPALFGGMAVVYISKNWKISVVPCVLMLLVFIIASYVTGSGDLAGTLIGVMVPVGVVVTLVSSRYMYKKGWLGEQGTPDAEPDIPAVSDAVPDAETEMAEIDAVTPENRGENAAKAVSDTKAAGNADNAAGGANVAAGAEKAGNAGDAPADSSAPGEDKK